MELVKFFSFFLLFFNLIKESLGSVKYIDVTSENQLKDALNEDTDIVINIKNDIVVNDTEKLQISNQISKVTIKGESPSKSKLIFSHQNSGIYFDKYINEINISDITLASSMTFLSNENIKFDNVIIDDGEYYFNMTMINQHNITITNSRFNPPQYEKSYYMTLYQAYLYIDHTQFYINKNIQNGIILMKNENNFHAYGKLHLTNVLLSGGYESRFFDIHNVKEVKLIDSEVKEAFSKSNLNGNINFSKCNNVIIQNVLFHDNYSENIGGSLYLYKVLVSNLNDLLFINSTAYSMGGAINFQTERIDHSDAFLKNITVKDAYVYDSTISRGQAISMNGYIVMDIEDLYCENIHSYQSDGPLIYINEDVKMEIKNVYAKEIYGRGVGALFINTVNTNENVINAENINFSDSYIKSYQNTAVLLWLIGGTFNGININVNNVGGDYASLVYLQNNAVGRFTNINVEEFDSKISYPLFLNDGQDNSQNTLEIFDSNIKNINSNGAIIFLQNTRGYIKNSTFQNIHICYDNNTCAVKLENLSEHDQSSIALLRYRSTLNVENVIFDSIYGVTGFLNNQYTTVNIRNSTFSNNKDIDGIFKFSDSYSGTFNIRYSNFLNNESEKGGVVHIDNVEITKYAISFYDSIFHNNVATMHGGVIFSVDPFVDERVLFENCEFLNNTSEFGNIAYSLNSYSEPKFTFSDSSILQRMKSVKNTFVTNPTKLIFSDDSYHINDVFSGEFIANDIIVEIYDDYDNKFSFGENIDEMVLNELVFFNIEIEDTEGKKDDVALFGQTQGYCWVDGCTINNIKIVGNPGDYVFKLKLLTYGSYNEFDDNEVSMDVRIKDCDESIYIYQNKDHPVLKSCYTPLCNPSCNSGVCINDNVCDCTNTPYTGLNCNEHYKLYRNEIMYFIYQVLAFILFGVTILCFILLMVYRNASIIKGGGFDFLILILFGFTFNSGYIISLSKERTEIKRCTIMYIMKNMGFALVFGSILVKTLRIFIIFKHIKQSLNLKLYKLYLIIISIFLFHALMVGWWTYYDEIHCDAQYTKTGEVYFDCQYPNTNIFSFIFNTTILAVGVVLAYHIRYVNDNFKESLAVPIYVYTLLSLFSEIVDHTYELPIFFKDSVGIIMISISSFVVLYYLFIQKFYIVSHQNKEERKKMITTAYSKPLDFKNKNNNNKNNQLKKQIYNKSLKNVERYGSQTLNNGSQVGSQVGSQDDYQNVV